MMNLWKVPLILLGICTNVVSYAREMLLIVPQSTSVTVSGKANQNYVMTWTVQNNLNKPTAIVLDSWGYNGLTTVAGRDECSTQQVASGSRCTIAMGISGSVIPGDNLTVSPKFCTPDHQLCSQATASNRLNLSKTSNPLPTGQWKVFSETPLDNFPEFVSINYPRLDIGVISGTYSPIVYQCPDLNSDLNCTTVDLQSIIDYEFTSMTNLSYSPSGALYGVFTKPHSEVSDVNPEQSYILTIPAGSSRWQEVSVSDGVALGLDTSSSLGLLVSRGFLNQVPSAVGGSLLFQSNGSVLTGTNTSSSDLSSIVADGLGNIYVAGVKSRSSSTIQPFSQIWRWNPSQNTYTAITMPDNIPQITSMVSDGNGTVYVSGLDLASNGHVWSYKTATGQFLDTGLVASSVTTLFYSPYGYLLAGGIENDDYNGAIWYYTNGVWTNMELNSSVFRGCSNVASITADANNDIVATGYDLFNTSTIWVFN